MKQQQLYDPTVELIKEELNKFRKLKRFLSVKEAAEFFCVKEKTIRKWIKNGHLSAIKVEQQYKIPRLSIIQLAQEKSNFKD